jgi:hypothetical protein
MSVKSFGPAGWASGEAYGSADLLRGMINNNAKITSAHLTGQFPGGPSS